MRLVVLTVAMLGIIGLWCAYPSMPIDAPAAADTSVDPAVAHPDWVEFETDGAVRYFPEPWPPRR